MLRINVNGSVFDIRFVYESKLKSGKYLTGKFNLNSKRATITTCEIVKVNPLQVDPILKYYTFSTGSVKQNLNDGFDKGFGRRLALTRAINKIKEVDKEFGDRFSEEAWKSYFASTKDGRKLKTV